MATIAVLGEPERVQDYALAGAIVLPTTGADAVRRAWAELDSGITVIVLTYSAARFLTAELADSTRLTAVMPE